MNQTKYRLAADMNGKRIYFSNHDSLGSAVQAFDKLDDYNLTLSSRPYSNIAIRDIYGNEVDVFAYCSFSNEN